MATFAVSVIASPSLFEVAELAQTPTVPPPTVTIRLVFACTPAFIELMIIAGTRTRLVIFSA